MILSIRIDCELHETVLLLLSKVYDVTKNQQRGQYARAHDAERLDVQVPVRQSVEVVVMVKRHVPAKNRGIDATLRHDQ